MFLLFYVMRLVFVNLVYYFVLAKQSKETKLVYTEG